MLQGANENLPETVPETRVNTGGHVAICVRFESDKSRKRRKFFGLINKCKTKSISDYLRHSIENRSIATNCTCIKNRELEI